MAHPATRTYELDPGILAIDVRKLAPIFPLRAVPRSLCDETDDEDTHDGWVSIRPRQRLAEAA